MASFRKKTLKSGKQSWEAIIDRKGFPRLSKSFPLLTDAKAWAAEKEAELNKGALREDPTKLLVETALQDYLDAHPEANRHEKGRINGLKGDFEGWAVGNLTQGRIKKYLAVLAETVIPPNPKKKKSHYLYEGDIEKTYSPATIRKFYYQLKKCLEWHSGQNNYLLPHACFVQTLPEAWTGQRDRRCDEDEKEKLFEAIEGRENAEDWKNLIDFMIETALRTSEVKKVKVKDFIEAQRILILNAEIVKTKKDRHVPLSKKAFAIAKAQTKNKDPEDLIFDLGVNISQIFKAITHKAKSKDLVLHDFRHEAISRFFEKGKLSDMEIMKITGHTQYSTLMRYTHLRPNLLVDKMD